MNLNRFKSQVSDKGLARNSRWVCSIFPPKDLSAVANSIDVPLGTMGNLNLPGIDLGTIPIADITNANNSLPDVQANMKLPTLGYTTINNGTVLEKLNLYCAQAQIPEREIINREWREHGESRQIGIVHSHSKGVTLTYYCSEDLAERFFFEQWQDIIFNSQTKKRSYYDDYVSRIEIDKYDASWKNVTSSYRLHEAYPSNIATQTLTYDESSIMRLDINLKFRYYERLK